jgi:hypothetical protein
MSLFKEPAPEMFWGGADGGLSLLEKGREFSSAPPRENGFSLRLRVAALRFAQNNTDS